MSDRVINGYYAGSEDADRGLGRDHILVEQALARMAADRAQPPARMAAPVPVPTKEPPIVISGGAYRVLRCLFKQVASGQRGIDPQRLAVDSAIGMYRLPITAVDSYLKELKKAGVVTVCAQGAVNFCERVQVDLGRQPRYEYATGKYVENGAILSVEALATML